MKSLADMAKWLLEKDVRAKNAVSFLLALIAVVVAYFATKNAQWFQELKEFGVPGVGLALIIVFLIVFLAVTLIYSCVAAHHQTKVAIQQARVDAKARMDQQDQTVRSNLQSLTDWQRKFLLRFIVEGRTQIPDFEVGQFKASWDSEMAVLVEKGIIKEHDIAGVYEIVPMYREYLEERWDRETGTLT